MITKPAEKAASKEPDHLESFPRLWVDEIVVKRVKEPRNMRRMLEKIVYPQIGK